MATAASSEALRQKVEEARIAQPQQNARAWLQQIEPELRRAVPRGVDPNRIVRLALTEIRRTPELALCTRDSLLGAVMWSAQLGLEIGAPLGQTYILPFRNQGVLEAQWILGYTGALALVYRSPRVKDVYVGTVRDGDGFTYRRGLEDVLVHEPADFSEDRKAVAHYLMIRYQDGGHYIAVMTPAEIEKRRKKALHGKPRSGAWVEWPEEMERKSVVRAHYKYLPMEIQDQRAFAADEMVLRASDADDGGVVIPTTAETPSETPSEPEAAAPRRERARASRDPAPSEPPPSRDPVGTEAPSQDADPRDLLRQQLGRLKITGSSLAILLDPFEAVDVAGLKAADARRLADVLAGIDAKGEDAAREAVEKMGGEAGA